MKTSVKYVCQELDETKHRLSLNFLRLVSVCNRRVIVFIRLAEEPPAYLRTQTLILSSTQELHCHVKRYPNLKRKDM